MHAASLVAALVMLAACTPGAPPARQPSPSDAPADSVPLGYGAQARRDLTSAVGTVPAPRIAEQRAARVEQLLMGSVAGVEVLPLPDGGFTIRVRNASALLGSAEPLFVIDGMPLPRGGVPGSALNGINPDDILRIDVLKDAAAAALYGSDGANGVVLITTKRK